MEASRTSSSQQVLCNDVGMEKKKKAKYHTHQRVALVLAVAFLVLALSVFSLRYLWSSRPAKVYNHHYKAVLDGVERDSVVEIDPGRRIEIFTTGNGSEEVVEVHDFKNMKTGATKCFEKIMDVILSEVNPRGITGIRFAEHQRCYIRTQTRQLPAATEAEDGEAEEAEQLVGETEATDMKVEDSQAWVPAEEAIVNPAFLFDSKIWEICQELPIHWIHRSPLSDAEVGDVDAPDAEVTGQRFARDALDHQAVHDYREVGMELDNRLDDNGYCCQHCRRGYRYCRRYHEPLGGFNQWPYYYQGGRVICQIVMPCNWWIARMLGRV